MIREVNAIAAACAEVSADLESNKRQKTEAAAKKQHKANRKKLLKEIEEETKTEELRPTLKAVMEPFLFFGEDRRRFQRPVQ